MQTGNSRYKGNGINTQRRNPNKGADRRKSDRRQQASDGMRTPTPQNHDITYNQQSHAQQVNQLAAQVGVANQNARHAQAAQKISYSKNVFKGIGIILWRPFGSFISFVKRIYTHMSLKFEQANLFNTSLRSLVNSVLIAVMVFGAAILYRNGQVANIKHAIIAQVGEWSAAAGVNVQKVELSNRQHSSREDILAALNVKIGTPLLSFDVAAAKARIEQIGWIEKAEVQRILPNKLEVSIIEREPFAIWQINGEHHLVDRNGVLVANEILRGYHLLPLIVGKGASTEALGLLNELEARPEIFEHVRALVRVGERRWDMDLHNGVRILLPAEKPETMLADLERMILDQGIFSRGIKLIDFRLKDRVRFEMDEPTAKAYHEAKLAAEKDKKNKS